MVIDMYTIDRELDQPLYIQIRNSIEQAILRGELKKGDRLPPVTVLAKEIGVTQATIRRALKDLGAAGYTKCHVGRGTFIRDPEDDSDKGEEEEYCGRDKELERVADRSNHGFRPRERAARMLRTGISKALADIMPMAHREGIIALTRGVPDSDLLPGNFMEDVCKLALTDGGLQYAVATDPVGNYELRKEIARRASMDGSSVTPDMVLITNGVSQAITLIAQSATEERNHVICETPCFQGLPNSFTAMGHWVDSVQRDEEGPIIAQLERFSRYSSNILYLCPYVHNPMGTDLSPERYDQLVEWARRTNSIVIADEIFRELRFEKAEQPSLLKELGAEQTIMVSSLSKSVMPGLRLGWIITSARRVQELAQLKRLMDHSTPAITQGMALQIFTSGKFDQHVDKMRTLYRRRMEVLLQSLQRMMPKGVRWSLPVGGFSILLELPKGYSSVALLLSAIDKGVSFLPAPLFDIDQRYVNGLRISTAWVEENEIKEGIELLADSIEEFIQAPSFEPGLSGLGGFQ